MSKIHRRLACWSAAPVLLVLTACGDQDDASQNLDSLDAELAGGIAANGRDPVLAGALQDQIMVDPALTIQANDDAIRPPARPLSGAVPPDAGAAEGKPGMRLHAVPPPSGDCPQCRAARASLTLGALAARHTAASSGECTGQLRYSATFAARLPAALPLYPDARVTEAAGIDANGCALRAVSFASAAPVPTVLAWYYTHARRAGYSAGHQAEGKDHVLAGTKATAAFTLYVSPASTGGSDVDLIANDGR